MKKIIQFFLQLIILISIIPATFANNDYEELDSIIVIVEKDVITKKELQDALSELRVNSRNKNIKYDNKKLKKIALEQLIERKIINQYAYTQGINIDSFLLENAIKKEDSKSLYSLFTKTRKIRKSITK